MVNRQNQSLEKHSREVRVLNRKKLGAASTALAIAMVAIMMQPVYAEPLYNFDTEYGTYTIADVGVCGQLGFDFKLYSPAAYATGIIYQDLPSGYTLKVQYRFEWMDEDFVVTVQEDIRYTSLTKAGQSVRIEPSGLPYVVYYIVAEARAGYGNVWDTDWACASLPWV